MDAGAAADVTFRHTGFPGGHQQHGYVDDLDGDGVLDLSLATWVANVVTLPSQLSTVLGPFAPHTDVPAGSDFTNTGTPDTNFGRVSELIHLDGDGIVDRVVGAPETYSLSAGPGTVYGLSASALVSGPIESVADLVIEGEIPDDNFGVNLAVGDWNGDGVDDLAVSNGHDPATMAAGRVGKVYVFFSPGAGTLHAADADRIIEGPALVDLNQVRNGGDTDGNGVDDLIIGSTYASDPARPGEALHGAAFLFLGPL